ncbi:hypothetical protein EI427_20880 [Flammeovirga pectinis]|uniref:Uncharacterized protein n=1 Tax=Flammeovirga pectinis TaxID=2494373 RepID=A0A3S9P8Y3_9BACT|nr:hypothetical protein [Flammeovirga pectinis]AZQ64681.1 hypothetical protein EI427_20880 [Flammeovirga pectinis]
MRRRTVTSIYKVKESFFGVMVLFVILCSILLFITSKTQTDKIVKEYCKESFWLGSHQLILYQNNSFVYKMTACLQTETIKGNWTSNGPLLSLDFNKSTPDLDTKYLNQGDSLQSLLSENEGFILCENLSYDSKK